MSNTHAISLKRSVSLLVAVTFLTLLTVVNFSALFGKASAADLTSRSLALSSTLVGTETEGDPGSATDGSAAEHKFTYTALTAGVTSTTFTYCTTAIGEGAGTAVNGCTAPTGLVLTGAAIPSGGTGTAAGVSNQITWTSSYDAGVQTVTFEGITNPTVEGTFFVRIATSAGDDGTVASAITEGIEITARVAETLGFSTTGEFTGVGDPGTTCAPVTGSGAITLGDPIENTLAIDSTYDNYSAFRLYTNSSGGVEVQYHGDTLRRNPTSDIDAIGAAAALSIVGTEQFGLAIDTVSGGDDGTNTPASTPVSVTSDDDDLEFQYVNDSTALSADGPLTPVAGVYDGGAGIINGGSEDAMFAFVVDTPTTIATTSSLNGGYTECKTVAVRYIANVSPTTSSGSYTTTVVYSAVPTY